MLMDRADTPRADTMLVAIHFNTTDVNVAELALGRLAAAGILLQWPRPDLSSAPPPTPVGVRREVDYCTTGRFLLYLPPDMFQAMAAPVLEPGSSRVPGPPYLLGNAHKKFEAKTQYRAL